VPIHEYELHRAANILAREILGLKPGEVLAITADTESDERVVEATAAAAHAAGAKPMVITVASPTGVGKAADPALPVEALGAALTKVDAWIEFNNQWLLYSTPFELATRDNPRLRYICLVGMNVDMMVRTIGRVDHEPLRAFMTKVAEMTRAAKEMRVTTPAGTDVHFFNDPTRPVSCDAGRADVPGVYFLSGQISWCPAYPSIEGVIVFDGTISPPLNRIVDAPVRLTVKEGRVEAIDGGRDALRYRAWLESFGDPNMLRMAHIAYGFNPGARLTGNVLEDERVWGVTEWGLGYVAPSDAPPNGIPAKSHTDGICLNASVWLEGVALLREGKVVHPGLLDLSRKLEAQ
jgi:leucyl aminopeptidase (aminopeptidase T)